VTDTARPGADAIAKAQESDEDVAPADPKSANGTDSDAPAKKPGKPLKLDPSLLQKVLQGRNANH
jgi:hypothetical protein